MSGALGKETFLLLPKGKGKLWYWNVEDKQSIWYKSIKIIEQDLPSSLDSVIIEIINIIKGKLSE